MKFDTNYFVYPVWIAIAEVHKTGWESKKNYFILTRKLEHVSNRETLSLNQRQILSIL